MPTETPMLMADWCTVALSALRLKTRLPCLSLFPPHQFCFLYPSVIPCTPLWQVNLSNRYMWMKLEDKLSVLVCSPPGGPVPVG